MKLALTRGAKPGAAVGAMLACVLALTVKCFHPVAAILPLLFPRFAIALRPLILKDK